MLKQMLTIPASMKSFPILGVLVLLGIIVSAGYFIVAKFFDIITGFTDIIFKPSKIFAKIFELPSKREWIKID